MKRKRDNQLNSKRLPPLKKRLITFFQTVVSVSHHFMSAINQRYFHHESLQKIPKPKQKNKGDCDEKMVGHSENLLKNLKKLKADPLVCPYYKTLTKVLVNFKVEQVADKLTDLFIALAHANFPYSQYTTLYEEIIAQALNVERILLAVYGSKLSLLDENLNDIWGMNDLVDCFIFLTNAKIFYHANKTLYRTLIASNEISNLKNEFVKLAELNLSYLEFYQAITENPFFAKEMTASFTTLINAGYVYPTHKTLFQSLLTHASEASCLGAGFSTLINGGFTYFQNSSLYRALITHSSDAYKLATVFVLLAEAGFIHQESNFFQKMACYVYGFFNIHLAVKGNESLYLLVTNHIHEVDIDKFSLALNSLLKLNISYQTHPHYFNTNLLIKYAHLTAYLINSLARLGLTFEYHAGVFEASLNYLNQPNVNVQLIKKIVKKIAIYLAKHPLLPRTEPSADTQAANLLSIIKNAPNNSRKTLTYGPLNKSKGTIEIEKLLKRILQISVDDIQIDFSDENYIFKFRNEPPINLSLLIRNANLTQLTLKANFVEKVYTLIQKLITTSEPINFTGPITQSLSLAHKTAINIYCGSRFRNINRFFRSETLEVSRKVKFNDNVSLDRLACFLLGCVIHDAVNKLNVFVDSLPEKMALNKIVNHHGLIPSQKNIVTLIKASTPILSEEELKNILAMNFERIEDFFPVNKVLDRKEFLDDEIIKSRLANPWFFPALTSFSNFHNGDADGNCQTKLINPPTYYVLKNCQGEVIFSQGEQVITNQIEGSGILYSEIVRSPSLARQNHYWSELALSVALKRHLSQAYKDESSQIVLNGKTIHRPNHNMPHVYRVMELITVVCHYFSFHAKDGGFLEFCNKISSEEIEWLRVAAAFSVTGRESEVGARDNLIRYEQYREASARNFTAFIDETNANNHMLKERLIQVVRYMGNPDYDKKLNSHCDDQERQTRNYFYYLLTIAHNLDLARCYPKEAYINALKLCQDLSVRNDKQQKTFNKMIRYNIELIKAHGGALNCDINHLDELVDVHVDYHEKYFPEASLSMKRLFELSQMVPRPSRKTTCTL